MTGGVGTPPRAQADSPIKRIRYALFLQKFIDRKFVGRKSVMCRITPYFLKPSPICMVVACPNRRDCQQKPPCRRRVFVCLIKPMLRATGCCFLNPFFVLPYRKCRLLPNDQIQRHCRQGFWLTFSCYVAATNAHCDLILAVHENHMGK